MAPQVKPVHPLVLQTMGNRCRPLSTPLMMCVQKKIRLPKKSPMAMFSQKRQKSRHRKNLRQWQPPSEARTHGGDPSPNDGKDARPAVARAIFYSPMQAQGETSSPNKRARHQSPLKSPIPMAQIMVDDQSVVISTISAHLLTAHQRVQRGHFGPPTHPREKALRLLRQHIVSLPMMMKKLPLKMGNSLPHINTTINHRCGAVLYIIASGGCGRRWEPDTTGT